MPTNGWRIMGVYKRGRPSRQEPPSSPGQYIFRDRKTGERVYIGETSTLKLRIAKHLASGVFSLVTHLVEWKLADRRSTSKTRREHERRKIDQHKPPVTTDVGAEVEERTIDLPTAFVQSFKYGWRPTDNVHSYGQLSLSVLMSLTLGTTQTYPASTSVSTRMGLSTIILVACLSVTPSVSR